MTAKKYFYAVGKRKTATAQVKLYEGKGDSTINGVSFQEYVKRGDLFGVLLRPLKLTKQDSNYYFDVKVEGAGESAQAQAIRHGISKALVDANPTLKKTIKEDGLITRDARQVERKKPGLHKARKASQWSKR
ncbi:MAG: 30S ribosomal protein S9 [Candidatus Gracilibacteria bacterium]|nr:30S ribosomal protein S9 [Candidatus Gracilibacteria bacterium]MDD4530800.1 30S ribosomal protein S9 [Candidatus Gracilibacteria bacterium]